MKKHLLSSAVIAIAGISLFAGSAFAYPSEDPGNGFSWTDSDYFTVTDLANTNDPYDYAGTFRLEWQNPSASYDSSFGIYAFQDTSKKLELFSFGTANGEFSTAFFKYDLGSWWVSTDENSGYKEFTFAFGFYADVDENKDPLTVEHTYYTDVTFNDDKTEHFAIAMHDPNIAKIYFEDVYGRSIDDERDISDLLIGSTDIQPVPEPATMLLFGAGLAGLASIRRKK